VLEVGERLDRWAPSIGGRERKIRERDGVGRWGALGWKRRWAGRKRLGREGKGKRKRGRRAAGLGREEREIEGLGGFGEFFSNLFKLIFQTFEIELFFKL
jgi:hypothetical protein